MSDGCVRISTKRWTASRSFKTPRLLHLVKRKDGLRDILNAADDDTLRYADEYPDPTKLLAAAESMGLEGIVSKLVEQPYRSGKNPGWVKVKTATWRAAKSDRWEMTEGK